MLKTDTVMHRTLSFMNQGHSQQEGLPRMEAERADPSWRHSGIFFGSRPSSAKSSGSRK
jgi:hypothetical protein